MTASVVWRKSSRSAQGTSDQCVEVAQLRQTVGSQSGTAYGMESVR